MTDLERWERQAGLEDDGGSRSWWSSEGEEVLRRPVLPFIVWYGRVQEVEERVKDGEMIFVWEDTDGSECWTKANGVPSFYTAAVATKHMAQKLREEASVLLRRAAELESK